MKLFLVILNQIMLLAISIQVNSMKRTFLEILRERVSFTRVFSFILQYSNLDTFLSSVNIDFDVTLSYWHPWPIGWNPKNQKGVFVDFWLLKNLLIKTVLMKDFSAIIQD